MTADLPFQSPYRHGFVRVAVAAPRLHLAQPAANAEETVRLARIADERGAALVVFPELGLSGYSVDDLFHQQGLLGAVRDAVATLVAASASLRAVMVVGAPLLHEAKLFNCAVVLHRGRILGVVPKAYLPNYREYYEKRQFTRAAMALGTEIELSGQTVPFGARGLPRPRPVRVLVLRRDLRGPLGAGAAQHLGGDGGRHHPLQPVGEQCRRRQGRLPRPAVRLALGPLHRRLPLRRRRLRRVDHRPGLGQPGHDLRERSSAGGGRAVLDRQPDRLRRRRRRAARARPHADDQLPGLDRRPPRAARRHPLGSVRVRAAARGRSISSAASIASPSCPAIARAATSAATRSIAFRCRGWRSDWRRPASVAWCSASLAASTRPRPCWWRPRPSTCSAARAATSWPTPCRGSPPAPTPSRTRAS